MNIEYKILSMQVNRSNITPECYEKEESNMQIANSFSFGVSVDNCLLICNHSLTLKSSEKVFAEVELQTIFSISEHSFNGMKEEGKIKIPDGFLVQCGSISYGSLRGIVLQDAKKAGLDNIIIPPLYINNIIKEPMIIDLEK